MVKFEDFIKILSESNNKLLVSNSETMTEWSKLKHNKEGLELFLNYNLAEVYFEDNEGTLKKVIACSNTSLIKMFSLKRESSGYKSTVRKLAGMKSKGIHNKEKTNVLTWNFLKNDYCRINITKTWYLGQWITLSENNVVILNETMKDILDNSKITRNITKNSNGVSKK